MSLALFLWELEKDTTLGGSFYHESGLRVPGHGMGGSIKMQESQRADLGGSAVVCLVADGLYTWLAQRDGTNMVVFLGK